jgi:hypothetical protein
VCLKFLQGLRRELLAETLQFRLHLGSLPAAATAGEGLAQPRRLAPKAVHVFTVAQPHCFGPEFGPLGALRNPHEAHRGGSSVHINRQASGVLRHPSAYDSGCPHPRAFPAVRPSIPRWPD